MDRRLGVLFGVGMVAAALTAAELLASAGRHAQPDLDSPLREFVTARLRRFNPAGT